MKGGDDNPFVRQGEAQRRGGPRLQRQVRRLDPDWEPPSLADAANPFAALGDAQTSSASKAKARAAQKISARAEEKRLMKQSPLELKRQEENELAKLYRKWKREQRDAMLSDHGDDMKELLRVLRGLHASSFADVEAYVRGSRWLLRADERTRLFVLSAIDASMVRASIRDGRPAFDDPLWDEPKSPFLNIRKLLTGV